jgi:pentapeptide MXKDX repeat protein
MTFIKSPAMLTLILSVIVLILACVLVSRQSCNEHFFQTPPVSSDAAMAAAMNQAAMNRAAMNQAAMNRAPMNQAAMNRAPMNQAPMNRAPMNQAPMNQEPMPGDMSYRAATDLVSRVGEVCDGEFDPAMSPICDAHITYLKATGDLNTPYDDTNNQRLELDATLAKAQEVAAKAKADAFMAEQTLKEVENQLTNLNNTPQPPQ